MAEQNADGCKPQYDRSIVWIITKGCVILVAKVSSIKIKKKVVKIIKIKYNRNIYCGSDDMVVIRAIKISNFLRRSYHDYYKDRGRRHIKYCAGGET